MKKYANLQTKPCIEGFDGHIQIKVMIDGLLIKWAGTILHVLHDIVPFGAPAQKVEKK